VVNTLGNQLNKALKILGFENPNNEISEPIKEAKKLKFKFEQLKVLNKDIEDIDNREIKKDIKEKLRMKINWLLYLKIKFYLNWLKSI
jgi:hypothetical protein